VNVLLLGAIATSGVIALAILAVMPAFLEAAHHESDPRLMISFSIVDENTPEWCRDVAAILQKHEVKATVFVTGKVAKSDSDCISLLSRNERLDIGSQTFNFRNLTSISDYSEALREVEWGKSAVDSAGNLDSRLFKAPYGSTDDNIFSYLSRSGIYADFSYNDHYNVSRDGIFVRMDSKSYRGIESQSVFLSGLESNNIPVIVEFDSSIESEMIDTFITELKMREGFGLDIQLVNASDLVRQDLTIRNGKSEGPS
jgi:hypothetical protein